jgi:hypothetical protein
LISKRFILIPISLLLLMLIIPVFKISATSTTITINPTNSYVTVNKNLSVDVNVTDVAYLTAWQFTVHFNTTLLNCTDVVEGPFLKTAGSTYYGKTIDNTLGTVLAYDTLLGSSYVNGTGVLATITFKALAVGDSSLLLSDTKLGDQNIPPQPITHTTNGGTAHVQAFTLTVSTVGSGSVTPNTTGLYYHYGEVVNLTAVPVTGWSFSSWSGDLIGSTNPGTLMITGNMGVTATFTQDHYTLTITVPGGGGSVNKNPDQATYTYGTNVTLTANATIGWTFGSWSGDASGTSSPTTVNMTGNKAVTATFNQNVYTLTTNVVGIGSVNRNNNGSYHYNDVVQLTAVPTIGWTFDHWSGDLTGSTNPDTLTITGDMVVTATFTQNTYTLNTTVEGSGSIIVNNTGSLHYGDIVQLTANPTVGWTFDHWKGSLIGSTNPATLTITGDMAVTANFTQNVYTLSVNVVGAGCNVTRDNNGPYHYNDVVHLTANAAIGWTFSHWSDNLTGSPNPATLTITGNTVVTATFTQDQYTLTITITGSGTVDKNPLQATYTYGTIVTLTANPAAGWSFDSWSGAVSGTTSPTTINMTGSKSVNATFIRNTYTLTTLIDPIGSGSVTLNITGPYNYNDVVLLTASANPNWIYHYWSGNLAGSANPTTLIMTSNFTVTAHFTQKPLIQMNPTSRTCRMYGETFSVVLNISNALNVEDFAFEIHFNTTLLTYVSVSWNAWGTGTISVIGGVITGNTSGSPINGTLTLVTIRLEATNSLHLWKSGVVNDINDVIFIQEANVSYPTGPDLRYVRSGINQIGIEPDFIYTFSPIMGDEDNNGSVNVLDLGPIAFYFGAKNGDPNWSVVSIYDIDNSGTLDVFDLRTVASQVPYTYMPPP